jgi:hypothetical protein
MKLPSRRGAAAEKRLARLTGATRTPASGGRWFAKADLQSASHLFESKTTQKKSYSLKLDALLKVEAEAAAQNREPLFVLEFDTPTGRHVFSVQRFYGTD